MAFLLLATTIIILILGYRNYARRMDRRVVQPDPRRSLPSVRKADGDEFVPTDRERLWAFQFKSTSLDPLLGPILAVQFGWLPAVLWLLAGGLFFGWIQDYGVLVLGVRNNGLSLGRLVEKYISQRTRRLLNAFLYLYLWMILGALTTIMAPVLARENVPIGFACLVVVGLLSGVLTHRWQVNPLVATGLCLLLGLVGVYAGSLSPAQNLVRAINDLAGNPAQVLFKAPLGLGEVTWTGLLWGSGILAFCYLGAVLPVWRFIQPVNYTAAGFVLVGMLTAIIGIVAATFTGSVDTFFEIPAFTVPSQPSLGPIWPILFVTISSGAVSGWHALVSSSTARQLRKETDALPVAAGSALSQTLLGVLAVIFAVVLGVSSGRYNAGHDYQLNAGAAGVFASGMARFVHAAGLPPAVGDALGPLFLAVITITVLPLTLRYMRQCGADLLGERFPSLTNPYIGALAAVLLVLLVIACGLWPWMWLLFGSANLMLAAVVLWLISVWLASESRPYHWTLWPAIFLYLTALAALLYTTFYTAIYQGFLGAVARPNPGAILGNLLTAALGLYLLNASVIILVDGIRAFTTAIRKSRFIQ
jgi:carbon starvation protein